MGGESYPLEVSSDGARDPLGCELLDAGAGRRLERFGERVVDRPAPGATAAPRAPSAWRAADLRFDPDRGWSGRADPGAPWSVVVEGLTLELRATSSGGVGLYPEHAANLAWLDAEIRARLPGATGTPPAVLNLFAHTGLATLAAARAGAAVAHVDAARASVAWARRNAALNGLEARPIRWLVDDAQALVDREARRGRRYQGIVLDPPSSGRARTSRWTLADDLPRLLAGCARIVADDAFVLLTAHSTGLDGETLAALLDEALPGLAGRREVRRLELAAPSGATLPLGWAVRASAGRPVPPARSSAGTGHHRG